MRSRSYDISRGEIPVVPPFTCLHSVPYARAIIQSLLTGHDGAHCVHVRIVTVVKLLDEHERTLAFAEVALGQIARFARPPSRATTRSGTSTRPDTTHRSTRSSTRRWRAAASSPKRISTQIYETYLSHDQDHGSHRQGRRTRHRRNRRRHAADHRCARRVRDLRREPRRRQRPALDRDDPRPDQDHRRGAGQVDARDARDQPGTGRTGSRLSKSEISDLQHSLEAIRAESLTDPLTGLGNRKYFDRSIDMAVQVALPTASRCRC